MQREAELLGLEGQVPKALRRSPFPSRRLSAASRAPPSVGSRCPAGVFRASLRLPYPAGRAPFFCLPKPPASPAAAAEAPSSSALAGLPSPSPAPAAVGFPRVSPEAGAAAVPPPGLGAALGPAVSGPDGASWPGPEQHLLGEAGLEGRGGRSPLCMRKRGCCPPPPG